MHGLLIPSNPESTCYLNRSRNFTISCLNDVTKETMKEKAKMIGDSRGKFQPISTIVPL